MRKLVRRSINSTRFEFTMPRTMYGIAAPCGNGFFFMKTGLVIRGSSLDYPRIIAQVAADGNHLPEAPVAFQQGTQVGNAVD